MGWWQQNRRGESFAINDGPEMVWGDGPADIMADALHQIVLEFVQAYEREPTCAEIRAGLEFALLKADDDATFPSGACA